VAARSGKQARDLRQTFEEPRALRTVLFTVRFPGLVAVLGMLDSDEVSRHSTQKGK
jgi:hypothetical protein